jgi:hypothetical protein
MLGELLTEDKGKVTGYRVLAGQGEGARVETSFQAVGKILGVDYKELGTYVSVIKPGGFLFGEGQGVMMTKDGDQVSWVGHGTGRFTPEGGTRFRGALYFQTASQKLARLNGTCGVFEYENDADDKTMSKTWEWK